jgi:hypothetical protein
VEALSAGFPQGRTTDERNFDAERRIVNAPRLLGNALIYLRVRALLLPQCFRTEGSEDNQKSA